MSILYIIYIYNYTYHIINIKIWGQDGKLPSKVAV